MKIKSVNIASFGKFKNFKIDFCDGFNVIYGDNEAGKSTVMSFVKMMFYGNGGRVSDMNRNLRKKYMPWDSSLMAGSIDFSHGGKNYRLEREFKGSNSTDRITLINTDLDTIESVSGKGDIGSTVFGLSETAFEKSIFIGGLGAPEKDTAAESEINGKLSNIASTGDEELSHELVNSRIRKAKEALMSRSKKVGSLDKAIIELQSLDEEIKNAVERENSISALEAQISEKERAASQIKAEGDRLFHIMKKAELFKKRANLTKYIEACKAEQSAKKALSLPDGSYATKEYADRIKDSLSSLEFAENSLAEKNAEIESIKNEIEAFQNCESDSSLDALNQQKQQLENKLKELDGHADSLRGSITALQIASSVKPKKSPNPVLLAVGTVLTLICGIAVALTLKSQSPVFYGGLVGAVIGLIIFIFGFIFKRTVSDNSAQAQLASSQNKLDTILKNIADTEQELTLLNSDINSILIDRGSKKALIESKQKELLSKQETMLTARSQLLEAKSALLSICEPFGHISGKSDALTIANEIEHQLTLLSSAEMMRNLAADSTNCQSYDEAVSRLNDLNTDETLRDISPEEAESAKDKIKSITSSSVKIREELATLGGNLKALTASGRTVPVLEIEKARLMSQISSQKDFCDIADIAMEALAEAAAQMRQSFGGALEAETSKIFSALTDSAYSSLNITKELDIKVNRDGIFGAKEWQFLSAGTVDQAYLALRLALIKLISEDKEALPLIMDDSLAQYDDNRAEKTVKFLKEFSKEHQLILFTCHKNIIDMSEKSGINTITM